MAVRDRRWLPAMFAGAVLAGLGGIAHTARAEEPVGSSTQQQLLDEVRALRAEVNQLKAQKTTPSAGAASQSAAVDDTSATKAAVAADAASRTHFLDAAANVLTGGYDPKGFVLRSDDGAFSLRPGVIIQARNVTTFRENGKNGRLDDETTNGWELRRTKFFLFGTAFSPKFQYKLQVANGVNVGSPANFVLDDAWMQYNFYDKPDRLGKFFVRVGQFKPPVNHEEYEVGDEKQMAVERSLINDLLGGGAIGPRSQGIQFAWNSPKDIFHAELMIHDGSGNIVAGGGNSKFPSTIGSLNTDWRDGAPGGTNVAQGSPVWGTAGRVEFKPIGKFEDYQDFTAIKKKDLLVFGIGADATQGINDTHVHAEADVQIKAFSKLSVFFAALGDFTDFRKTPTGTNIVNNFDYGGEVIVAYAINNAWEPYVRADAIKFDDDLVKSDNLVSELGLGLNWYLGKDGAYGHHAKVTFEGNYLPSGSGPTDRTGVDELANKGRNEFTFRAQFQLWL